MSEERCPSCKGYLNDNEECDVCGWTIGDNISTVSGGDMVQKEPEEETSGEVAEEETIIAEEVPEIELDPREMGISKIMKLHGISKAKAERLYTSRTPELEEEAEEELGHVEISIEEDNVLEEKVTSEVIAEVEKEPEEVVIAEVMEDPIVAEEVVEHDLEEVVIAETIEEEQKPTTEIKEPSPKKKRKLIKRRPKENV